MATREVIEYECDGCGLLTDDDDSVQTHTLSVDKNGAEVDMCASCWDELGPRLAALIEAGRRTKVRLAA